MIKKQTIAGVFCAGLFSLAVTTTTNAALLGRLPATPGGTDYQAYYDTTLDITWLADANLAASNTFGVSGIRADGWMLWDVANSWITAMNSASYLGYSDWRLPVSLQPDPACSAQSSLGSYGSNCIGSEMGHLFYEEFGASANSSVTSTGNPVELAKFTNISLGDYWTGTRTSNSYETIWEFSFGSGQQNVQPTQFFTPLGFSWAVRSGDVSAVPVPPAMWLFGSGLIGLLGVVKRKQHLFYV